MTAPIQPPLSADGVIEHSDGTLELVRVVPQTTAVGYGVDLVCINDLDPGLATTDPFSRQGLAQDCFHRITTRRETLPDDPDYGIDVYEFLHGGKTLADLRAAEGKIITEIDKDDRVSSVTASVVWQALTKRLSITVRVVPIDPSLGPFSLIIAVTDGGALLQQVTA